MALAAHFSVLIAQLGHITELAASDWLRPNAGSPERAGSAAWIAEVLDERPTRELLESILKAAAEDSAQAHSWRADWPYVYASLPQGVSARNQGSPSRCRR